MSYTKGRRASPNTGLTLDPITRAWLEKAAKQLGMTAETIQFVALREYLTKHVEPPPIGKVEAPASAAPPSDDRLNARIKAAPIDMDETDFQPLPPR